MGEGSRCPLRVRQRDAARVLWDQPLRLRDVPRVPGRRLLPPLLRRVQRPVDAERRQSELQRRCVPPPAPSDAPRTLPGGETDGPEGSAVPESRSGAEWPWGDSTGCRKEMGNSAGAEFAMPEHQDGHCFVSPRFRANPCPGLPAAPPANATACQAAALQAAGASYVPQCASDGSYVPRQCDAVSCWCVNAAGQELSGTRSTDRNLKCDGAPRACFRGGGSLAPEERTKHRTRRLTKYQPLVYYASPFPHFKRHLGQSTGWLGSGVPRLSLALPPSLSPPRVRNRRVYLAYTQICQTPQIFRYFRNFFLWLLSEIVNTDEMEYQSQGVQGHENAFFFGSRYVGRRGEVSPQPPTPGPEGHLMSSPAPPLAPSQAAARTWGWSWASRWAFRSARCCWRPSRAAPTAAQGIS